MQQSDSRARGSSGTVFNIQPFSIQDGPGIRTTVFLLGCNLRCKWCHNPESWELEPVLEFSPEKCIGCGACFALCPAHFLNGEGVHEIDRERCNVCGKCADSCYAGALAITGQEMSAERLLRRIAEDRPYYQDSGGGVTFSGGECMLQIDFLERVLMGCREIGVHTAVDTAGHLPYEWFQRVLPYTDLFLYDLKAAAEEVHRDLTGVGSGRIWDNLARLLSDGAEVIVRVPCIPGANWEELPLIAQRLSALPVKRVELCPYHRLGEGKFAMLGLEGERYTVPTNEEMESLLPLFEKEGRAVTYTKQ